MGDYEFFFERDDGRAATFIVSESCISKATKHLKKEFPNDHGADGFVILPNGNAAPINW